MYRFQLAKETLRFPVPLLLALAVAIFVFHALFYWQWLEDDAFISLRYAQNFVDGNGLAFNPGQTIEGYSNFAWVMLSAASLKLGWDPLLIVRLVGILGGVITLLLSWRLALFLQPTAIYTSLAAPFFLALSPVLPRHATNGLETCAYTAMLCLALYWAPAPKPGWLRRFALLLTVLLLSLLRPEGAAFAALILLWRIRQSRRFYYPGSPLGDLVSFALLYALYYAWRWSYFGDALSNIFYFKMTGGPAAILPGLHYGLDFLRSNGGAALVGLGLLPLLSRRRTRLYRLFLMVIAGQTALVLLVGRDWMHHYRFFVPVAPLLAASMASGLAVLAKLLAGYPRQRVLQLILAIILLTAYMNIYKTERAIARQVMPAVNSGEYLVQAYQRVGLWLKENTPAGATVAISDVGAVGFYSQREIIDMFGLVDAHIARLPGSVHHKSDPDYVLAKQPDVIVLVSRTDGSYWRIPDRDMSQHPEFLVEYEEAHEVAIGYGAETASLYLRKTPATRD